MSDFNIKATKNTPAVTYTAGNGRIALVGVSYPEDARSFYESLTQRISDLEKPRRLHFVFDLQYVSSSSVACTLQMLKDLKARFTNCVFSIDFLHDEGDDDMASIGENYESLSGINVRLICR